MCLDLSDGAASVKYANVEQLEANTLDVFFFDEISGGLLGRDDKAVVSLFDRLVLRFKVVADSLKSGEDGGCNSLHLG